MNREIKFRGYATGIGWVYGSLVNNLWTYSELSGNEKGSPVFEIITGKYDGSCWTDVAEEEGEAIVSVVPQSVGQFTGLLDKNGKEIYEGDFINIGNETYGFMQGKDGKLAAYEVKHEGCDYVLKRHDVGTLKWGRLSRLEELLWQCQVVGNVFENPELLNP